MLRLAASEQQLRAANQQLAASEKQLQKANYAMGVCRQQTLEFLIGSDTIGAKRDKGRKYLLLLDIRMPGISGIEVLETVKKHEQTSEIPVIMVTTSGGHQIAEQCYDLGCEAHVVKPISESLTRIIERVGGHL